VESVKVFLYKNRVQSVACLILNAQGKLHYDYWLHNATQDNKYFQQAAIHYAQANGINLIETHNQNIDRWIRKNTHVGSMLQQERNMMQWVENIARHAEKIGVPNDEIYEFTTRAEQIVIVPRPLVTVGLDLSTDELHRTRTCSGTAWKVLDYPLIELEYSRQDCIKIVEDARLQVQGEKQEQCREIIMKGGG